MNEYEIFRIVKILSNSIEENLEAVEEFNARTEEIVEELQKKYKFLIIGGSTGISFVK